MSRVPHHIQQEADQMGVPVIPPLPEPIVPGLPGTGPCDPNPVVAVCGQCGLHISRTMGYACGHPRCPTGLGGGSCMSVGLPGAGSAPSCNLGTTGATA